MKISDDIMRRIGEGKRIITPVCETSNLYADLGYDSLAFVGLLINIEEAYSIRFTLSEMGECLQANRLVALVQRKVEEND